MHRLPFQILLMTAISTMVAVRGGAGTFGRCDNRVTVPSLTTMHIVIVLMPYMMHVCHINSIVTVAFRSKFCIHMINYNANQDQHQHIEHSTRECRFFA